MSLLEAAAVALKQQRERIAEEDRRRAEAFRRHRFETSKGELQKGLENLGVTSADIGDDDGSA